MIRAVLGLPAPRQLIHLIMQPTSPSTTTTSTTTTTTTSTASAYGNILCADVLIDHDFLDGPCLRLAISRALSYVLMLGALLYKLPVIMNILKAGCVAGIDLYGGLYLETSCYIADLVYKVRRGLPFATYGDTIANICSNLIITLFAMLWGQKPGRTEVPGWGNRVLVLAAFFGFYQAGLSIPSSQLHYIISYTIIVISIARLSQIYKNFASGELGVQSIATALMAALGSAAKAYSTFIEVKDDPLLQYGYLLVAVLNALLVIQLFMLKGKGKGESKRDKEAEKKNN